MHKKEIRAILLKFQVSKVKCLNFRNLKFGGARKFAHFLGSVKN